MRKVQYVNAFFVCCVLCLGLGTIKAQSPYELNWKKDLSLYGLGIVGQATVYFTGVANLNDLTDEELEGLNPARINRFDRRATSMYSLRARSYSDVIFHSSYAFPLLFLLDKKGRKGFLEIGVLAGETYLLTITSTFITKIAVQRIRPLAYNPDVPLDKRRSSGVRLSFFSGHTSSTSALSFFSAKVFSDHYPDSEWKPVVWSAAAILPAATGWFRVKGGKHFPTDVIVGYAVGALIGVAVPHFHLKKNKKVDLSLSGNGSTIGLTMNW